MRRRSALALALAGASAAAAPAWAQVPPPPYAYIRGSDAARDELSAGRVPLPKGRPDLWLRANFRNLGYYLKRPGWGIFIKSLALRTRGGPFHQWDTLPGSKNPLLLVQVDGRTINRADGGIAGFSPPDDAAVDLLIADDGSVATRHVPLELVVDTLDGPYVIGVAPSSLNDYLP